MQTGCEKSHTGEQRWTVVDSEFYEYVSSQIAIVGFGVGYGTTHGKNTSPINPSRLKQAEMSINWGIMPPK
eukprot:11187869-Lingulodinium_polyedra.AAC.1